MVDVSKRRRQPKGVPGAGRFAREEKTSMADDLGVPEPAGEYSTGGMSPLRTVKGLSRLLYRMGRTFDNLTTGRLDTEEFLRTGNPQVVASRSDFNLLCDLMDASKFILNTDYSEPLTVEWVEGINARLTRSAAMWPGRLRDDTVPVGVRTRYGVWEPPTPTLGGIEECLQQADREADDMLAAAGLFAGLARMQPFGDGNKRTAMLAANGLLIQRDSPRMLAVPVEDGDRQVFAGKLGYWYMFGRADVVGWLADWNLRNPAD